MAISYGTVKPPANNLDVKKPATAQAISSKVAALNTGTAPSNTGKTTANAGTTTAPVKFDSNVDYGAKIDAALASGSKASDPVVQSLISQRNAKIAAANPGTYDNATIHQYDSLAPTPAKTDGVTTTGVVPVPTVTQAPSVITNQSYGYNPYNQMSQADYLAMKNQVTQNTANAQYDAQIADLKTKLAQTLADQNLAIQKAKQGYDTAYANNLGNKYQAEQNTQNTLAKRGLLNTGIDVGNQQANQMNYNMSQQAIDLQKQQQLDTINNEINKANQTAGLQENSINAQKQAYIGAQNAQALNDYNDYNMKAYGLNADNYWKGVGASQANQGLQLQQRGQDQQYNLSTAQMQQQANQFNATYGQNDKFHQDQMGLEQQKINQQADQFATQLKQQNDQFLKTYGLDQNKFEESKRQFDAQMGFNEKQLAQQKELTLKQISASIQAANISASVASQRFQMEKDQYNNAFKALGYDPSLVPIYTQMSNNTLNQLQKVVDNKENYANGSEMAKAVDNIVNASGLPFTMRQNLMDTVKNTFTDSAGQPLTNPSGPKGAPDYAAITQEYNLGSPRGWDSTPIKYPDFGPTTITSVR